MDEDNNIKNERKSYRKFIRPGYKPSMVCPQTDAKWRQRVISMLRNPPPVLQGSASVQQEVDSSDDADSSDSQQIDLETASSVSSSTDIERDESLEEDSEVYSEDHSENHSDGNNHREEEFQNEPINNEVNDEANNEDFDNGFPDSDIDNGGPAPKYPWENRILFPQSSLTVRDTVGMARGFCLRFGLSLEARLALMNLLI